MYNGVAAVLYILSGVLKPYGTYMEHSWNSSDCGIQEPHEVAEYVEVQGGFRSQSGILSRVSK